MGVDGLFRVEAGRRIAGRNRSNRAIFGDHQITREWIPLLGCHREETCILDHQLGGSSQQTGGRTADGDQNQKDR